MELHLQRILLIVITVLLIPVTLICCTSNSTVCYGPSGILCATHRLSCLSQLVIEIINTSYGHRPGCANIIGRNECNNTACCNEEPGDCFIPFSTEESQQVARNCSKRNTCSVSGFRRFNNTGYVCNGSVISAYSKIQYDCVIEGTSSTTLTQTTYQASTSATSTSKDSSVATASTLSHETIVASSSDEGISSTTLTQTTSQSSTSKDSSVATTSTLGHESNGAGSSDVGSIVGGLFGAIIIIVLIVLVVLFLYKRNRSKKSTNKETTFQTETYYSTIDGPNSSTIKTQNTSGYDEIDLNCKPISTDRISNMRNHDHSVDEDNYNHIGEKSTRPTQLETDYNHITGVLGTSNVEDDYNHIGGNDNKKVIIDDNYHHIRNNLSTSPRQFDTDYNHITGVLGTSNVEDDYNHIGNNDNKKIIIDDNYLYIRSGDIQVEGDYNHIGADELTSGCDDHYNHIYDDNNHSPESDNHNSDVDGAPYNFATC